MKTNTRLSVLFAALAVVVAVSGLESPATGDESVAWRAAASWANAFPVAQAGFAEPAPAAE